MPDLQFIEALLQQATLKGSRTNVLNPLYWFAGIFLTALIGAIRLNAPHWIDVVIVGILCACCCLFLAAYVYFAMKNPDALRSERYGLSKMALQMSRLGDTAKGFEIKEVKSLPSTTTHTESEQ